MQVGSASTAPPLGSAESDHRRRFGGRPRPKTTPVKRPSIQTGTKPASSRTSDLAAARNESVGASGARRRLERHVGDGDDACPQPSGRAAAERTLAGRAAVGQRALRSRQRQRTTPALAESSDVFRVRPRPGELHVACHRVATRCARVGERRRAARCDRPEPASTQARGMPQRRSTPRPARPRVAGADRTDGGALCLQAPSRPCRS